MSEKKQNISLMGCIGAGKSSVAAELEKYGYRIITAGQLFRQYAKDHHMSIEEAISGHPEIDAEIDSNIARIGKEENGIVFDSRMAWHFVPDSFKVFIYTDIDTAAERVFAAKRDTEQFVNVKECEKHIFSRQLSELSNYTKLYGQDYMDSKNYDLFIDATYATPEQTAKKIIDCLEHQQAKFQMNPRSLYPTQTIRDLSGETLNKYLAKELPAGNICISCYDGYFGVTDGHHRYLAAAINKEPFIGAEYDPSPEKSKIVCKTEIYNYEDVAGFYYPAYPEDFSKDCLIEFCNENFPDQKEKDPQIEMDL